MCRSFSRQASLIDFLLVALFKSYLAPLIMLYGVPIRDRKKRQINAHQNQQDISLIFIIKHVQGKDDRPHKLHHGHSRGFHLFTVSHSKTNNEYNDNI
jgi:hypothetical protein